MDRSLGALTGGLRSAFRFGGMLADDVESAVAPQSPAPVNASVGTDLVVVDGISRGSAACEIVIATDLSGGSCAMPTDEELLGQEPPSDEDVFGWGSTD